MTKQQLLEAVETQNVDAFLNLIQGHEKKRKTVDLEEIVLELSPDEVTHIWDCLQSWADKQITAFVAKEEQEGTITSGQIREDAATGTVCTEKDGMAEYNEHLLEGIVKFGTIYISTFKEGATILIPDKLLEMTLLMHEMMIVLEDGAKKAVMELCELWWLRGLETRELLVANTLTCLLKAATTKGAQKKNVVQLWKFHEALNAVDLCSNDKKDLVKLLTSCASCLLFLSCDEGIKFLARLFSWPPLIAPLHKEIRLAITECSKAQSAKYGEIYFKAWKASQGNTKKTLEEDCIQDLMHTAIHVNPMLSRPSANLHTLLHHIHSYKKHRSVITLITELYQPILWRSFSVANGYVRMNATGLLCDAFPLRDCNQSQEEQEELMEKQYQTLKTLLLDPCHLVRITAVKGVFNIFSKYWILVPSEVIKAIFKIILNVLVYDTSTANVRLEVVQGLTLLLGNADAVPFLSQVLPRLGDVFDDANSYVREAFAKLLLKVKETKALKYWEIVPVHHLLHRLELDNSKVAQRITRLLFTSFHPSSKSDEELLQRSLSLLEENRLAARKFYQYASSMMDLPGVVHFMLLLWLCLANHIAVQEQEQQQQSLQYSEDEESESNEDDSTSLGRRVGSKHSSQSSRRCDRAVLSVSTSNKENAAEVTGAAVRNRASRLGKDSFPNKDDGSGDCVSDAERDKDDEEAEGEDGNPMDNPELLGGILDTVGILWTTNAHRLALPQNAKYLEALRTKISCNFNHFFRFFKSNPDASRTLLYIASFLPKSMVPTLVGHCLSQLKAMEAEQILSGHDTYKSYVSALCNWNRADSVLELASEWLEEGFTSGLSSSTKEKRRSRRQVRFCETGTPKPRVALRFLGHILEHPLNRVSTLQRFRPQLLELIQDMSRIKDVINERLLQSAELSDVCSDKLLCECWSMYLRLVVVCHCNPTPQQPAGERRKRGERSVASVETDQYFNSPSCISEYLEWASEALLPYVGERSTVKRKLHDTEEVVTLVTTVLKHLVTSSTHLLIIGAANVPFVYNLNNFVKTLLDTDTSGKFWEESLFLARESYEFLWVYESAEDLEEDQVTPIQLATTCISSLSEYFKHHDQLPKEYEELNSTLVDFLLLLGQHSRQEQAEMLQGMMVSVVEHITWRLSKDEDVDSVKEVKKVQHLGGFVTLVVATLQKQSKLSIPTMNVFSQFLLTGVEDVMCLLAACLLIKVLFQDGGKISRYSLKQTVVAASTAISSIVLPTAEGEDGEEEEASAALSNHQKAAKNAQEIVDYLKDSLGIM